jgi:hypothetical protein
MLMLSLEYKEIKVVFLPSATKAWRKLLCRDDKKVPKTHHFRNTLDGSKAALLHENIESLLSDATIPDIRLDLMLGVNSTSSLWLFTERRSSLGDG